MKNIKEVAAALGVKRASLQVWLQELGIAPTEQTEELGRLVNKYDEAKIEQIRKALRERAERIAQDRAERAAEARDARTRRLH